MYRHEMGAHKLLIYLQRIFCVCYSSVNSVCTCIKQFRYTTSDFRALISTDIFLHHFSVKKASIIEVMVSVFKV